VFSVIATAAQGMATQSRRIEAAAANIASSGIAPRTSDGPQPAMPRTRIGALPVDDLVTNVVTLIEAKQVYAANALVVAVASDMLDTLLDAVHPAERD
jgi:flagellar basal body rod protein FlgC